MCRVGQIDACRTAFILCALVLFGEGFAQQGMGILEKLVVDADAVVAAKIVGADYSATPSDGPLVGQAKVVKSVKGPFERGDTFSFKESAWVGPTYTEGELRILLLDWYDSPDAHLAGWWILSYLSVRVDLFINKDSIAVFSLESLNTFLQKLQDGGSIPEKAMFGGRM